MTKVKGVNIFPGQIEDLLAAVDGASSEYQVMIDHVNGKDAMLLSVECEAGTDKETMQAMIQSRFKSKIGISITVHAVGIGDLPRSEKKSKRIIDKRY